MNKRIIMAIEKEGMMTQHIMKIVPAIAPIARHRIEDTLAKIGCKPSGGGTRTNWSFSDISFDHKEGLKEVQLAVKIIKHKHMREIDQIGGDGIRVVTIRPALLERDRKIVEAAFKAMGYKIFGGNTARDLSSSEFAFAWR